MAYPNIFATQPAGNVLASLLDANFAFALAKDGSVTPTAGMPFFAGTVALPGIIFGTDTQSGLYRIGLNHIGLAIAGVKLLDFGAALLGVTGALTVSTTLGCTGNVTFGGNLTLSTYGSGTGLVTAGAVDSGGAGFKLLRVPN